MLASKHKAGRNTRGNKDNQRSKIRAKDANDPHERVETEKLHEKHHEKEETHIVIWGCWVTGIDGNGEWGSVKCLMVVLDLLLAVEKENLTAAAAAVLATTVDGEPQQTVLVDSLLTEASNDAHLLDGRDQDGVLHGSEGAGQRAAIEPVGVGGLVELLSNSMTRGVSGSSSAEGTEDSAQAGEGAADGVAQRASDAEQRHV